jgi:hypothetical protein
VAIWQVKKDDVDMKRGFGTGPILEPGMVKGRQVPPFYTVPHPTECLPHLLGCTEVILKPALVVAVFGNDNGSGFGRWMKTGK